MVLLSGHFSTRAWATIARIKAALRSAAVVLNLTPIYIGGGLGQQIPLESIYRRMEIFLTLHKDAKTEVGSVAPPSIHLSIESDTSRA